MRIRSAIRPSFSQVPPSAIPMEGVANHNRLVEVTPTTPQTRVSAVPDSAWNTAKAIGNTEWLWPVPPSKHLDREERAKRRAEREKADRAARDAEEAALVSPQVNTTTAATNSLPEVFCAQGVGQPPSSPVSAPSPVSAELDQAFRATVKTVERPGATKKDFEVCADRLLNRGPKTFLQWLFSKTPSLKYRQTDPITGEVKMVNGGGLRAIMQRFCESLRSVFADRDHRTQQAEVAGGFTAALIEKHPTLAALSSEQLGVEILHAMGADLALLSQGLREPLKHSVLRQALVAAMGVERSVLRPRTDEERQQARVLAGQQGSTQDITAFCNKDLLALGKVIASTPPLQRFYFGHEGEAAYGLSAFVPIPDTPLNAVIEGLYAKKRAVKATFEGVDQDTVSFNLSLSRSSSLTLALGLASLFDIVNTGGDYAAHTVQPWGILMGVLKGGADKHFELQMSLKRTDAQAFVQALVDCDFRQMLALTGSPTLSAGNGQSLSFEVMSQAMTRFINTMGQAHMNQRGGYWLRRQLGVMLKTLRLAAAKTDKKSVDASGEVKTWTEAERDHLKSTFRAFEQLVQTPILPWLFYGHDQPVHADADASQAASSTRRTAGSTTHEVSLAALSGKSRLFTKPAAYLQNLRQAVRDCPALAQALAAKKDFDGKVQLVEKDGVVQEIIFSRKGVKLRSQSFLAILFKYNAKKMCGVEEINKIVLERGADGKVSGFNRGLPAPAAARPLVSDLGLTRMGPARTVPRSDNTSSTQSLTPSSTAAQEEKVDVASPAESSPLPAVAEEEKVEQSDPYSGVFRKQ
ncbi:MAG: hypothetical protein KTR20_10620 [Cellvibrionaceae bacterium]|nr:hypothetical protein [Cellvibrionaceae bacterium]